MWFPAHLALGAILETQIEAYLADRAVPFVNEWHGPNTRLSAWAAAPEGKSVDAPAVRFALPGSAGGAIELAGVTAAREPVEAANAVTPISLQWRAEQPPPVLGVSVRLTDALGQIWAQHDYEPLGSASRLQAAKRQLTQTKDRMVAPPTVSACSSPRGRRPDATPSSCWCVRMAVNVPWKRALSTASR